MKIGIIGSGHIGGTLGKLFAAAGHGIMFASRTPSRLEPLASEVPGASAGTPTDAADLGEVIVVATPYGAWPRIGEDLANLLAGKVVIDAANHYPERDGAMADQALAYGSGRATAAYLPGVRVVKAFDTLYWKDLAEKGGQGFGMALAGDDADAVAIVSGLVRDAGFQPVIAGGLDEARRFDPGRPAYAQTLSPQALREALAPRQEGVTS